MKRTREIRRKIRVRRNEQNYRNEELVAHQTNDVDLYDGGNQRK